jgi:hypothetical protein
LALQIRTAADGVPTFFSTTDVGAGGCYVQTMLPLQKGTELGVIIWVGSDRLASSAVVRTCDAGLGMGIEFTGLTEACQEVLATYLKSQSQECAKDSAVEDPRCLTH